MARVRRRPRTFVCNGRTALAERSSSDRSFPPAPFIFVREQPGFIKTARHEDAMHLHTTMNPAERAYHERFMREAIAMVNHPPRPPSPGLGPPSPPPWLTHVPDRPSLR